MTQQTPKGGGSSARTPAPPVSSSRRWVGAVAAGVAVVAMVVVVQVVVDDESGVEPVGSPVPGSSSADAGTPSQAPATGAGIAAGVQLFGSSEAASDVTRESVDDVAASWPVEECAPLDIGAASGIEEPARVDFVSGTESGPEYGRDLAIGWYADDAAATVAYDALVAAVADCADKSGAELTTSGAEVGTAGSILTITQPAVEGAVNASLYAVSHAGAVVVLAADHAAFYDEGPVPADSAAGTTEQAERLLAEACRVAPGGC